MHLFLAVLISLVAGALVSSAAESKLQYNLFDFTLDKLSGLLKMIGL